MAESLFKIILRLLLKQRVKPKEMLYSMFGKSSTVLDSQQHSLLNERAILHGGKGFPMKFRVNDACIGCGLCASTCPEVFRMTDENVAVANEEEVASQLENAAREAQENCPVSAIEEE